MIDDIEITKAIETQPHDRTDHPVTNRIHPYVFRAIALLALWFVLGAWGFFAPTGYVGLALAVVSAFVLVAVGLPFVLSRFARKRIALDPTARRPGSLREWLAGDVDTWQERLSGRDAIVAILLPILAGAVGMTAFAIVLHIAVRHRV
jgi:hypothetical protein